ncbi:hypothetical protein M3Y98_00000600 [Aphelenchoides besseyi]|nr:hypothetical protein M3Y98_00000600 [Aphelenchoides besseyi]KAI6198427.1 hypothetical protein M3Y96_00518200 [Aphelenchoides besseyi]
MCSQDANEKSNGRTEIGHGSSSLELLNDKGNESQTSTSEPTAEFKRLLVAPPLYPPLLYGPLPRPIGYSDNDATLSFNDPTVSAERRNVPIHYGLRDPRLGYRRHYDFSNSRESEQQTPSAAQSNEQSSRQEATSFQESSTSCDRSPAQSRQQIPQLTSLTNDASTSRPRTPQPVPPFDPEAFARRLEYITICRTSEHQRTPQHLNSYATDHRKTSQSASSSNSQATYYDHLNPRFSPPRILQSTPRTPLTPIVPKRPNSVRSTNQRPQINIYRPRSPSPKPSYATSDFCWEWDTPLARPPKRSSDTQTVRSRERSSTPTAKRSRQQRNRQFFNGSAYPYYPHQSNRRRQSNSGLQLNARFQSNGRQTPSVGAQQFGSSRQNTPRRIPDVIILSSDEEPDIIVVTPET